MFCLLTQYRANIIIIPEKTLWFLCILMPRPLYSCGSTLTLRELQSPAAPSGPFHPILRPRCARTCLGRTPPVKTSGLRFLLVRKSKQVSSLLTRASVPVPGGGHVSQSQCTAARLKRKRCPKNWDILCVLGGILLKMSRFLGHL